MAAPQERLRQPCRPTRLLVWQRADGTIERVAAEGVEVDCQCSYCGHAWSVPWSDERPPDAIYARLENCWGRRAAFRAAMLAMERGPLAIPDPVGTPGELPCSPS